MSFEHPDRGVGVLLRREPFGEQAGGCRQGPPCPAPLVKESLGRCGDLGSWEGTFRNVALGWPLSRPGLTQALGRGGDLRVFASPDFYLRVSPEELKKDILKT